VPGDYFSIDIENLRVAESFIADRYYPRLGKAWSLDAMKRLYSLYVKAITVLIALTLVSACGSLDGGSDGSSDVDLHAGHDHGPGEHDESLAASDDHSPAVSDSDNDENVAAGDSDFDWCVEHSVPESVCTRCHPQLIEQFRTTGDWCPPHDLPESHCRLCNPEIRFPQEEILLSRAAESTDHEISVSLFFRSNSSVCATDNALIQFASAGTGQKIGLTVHPVRHGSLESRIEAPAEVVFDETHSNVVNSTVPALVSRWRVAPGDLVSRGQVIAILSSPEIAELESRLLSAAAALEVQQKVSSRHENLKAASLISDSDYEHQVSLEEQAMAEYMAARGLLVAAGMDSSDIDEIIALRNVSSSFALRAPADGVIVDRIALLGELLEAGKPFALLADPSSMWIEARLTEEQLRQVSVGQTLLFASDGRGLGRVGARVIWVSRYLDVHSRTGTVRAEIVDPNHNLQAGEFGLASIMREETDPVTLVHKDAVQWEGCCNVVFVKETDMRYRPRKVEILGATGPFYQVVGDVTPRSEVVVDGAFLLKTELKKTSLGAGCCGLEPTG